MLLISLILCGISLNYFAKNSKPMSLGAQLYLIFFNCIPRLFQGVIVSIIEIVLHIYFQNIARNFNMGDELIYKIFLMDALGYFFPAILEFSGFVAKPYFFADFIKYNIMYLFNFVYIFFLEGEEIRYLVVGAQIFTILLNIVTYFRKKFRLKAVYENTSKIYSMAGSSVEDTYNYLIVEDDQLSVASFYPKVNIIRSYSIPMTYTFVGFAVPARVAIFYDRASFTFKSFDVSTFKLICSIQSEPDVSYIVHSKKNYLAVFSILASGQDGTMINVYDCVSGEQVVQVALSHKINKQENMHLFDSFAIDLDKTTDKLIFSYERLLCSFDIDTKVNETLTTEFSNGFSLFKANERRIILTGKEDWAEMFDVPTNQPASLSNVYLSYSRIIPIQNLNDYYFVEPCCSKKNVYIMKGYGYDLQIITYLDLGFPNISSAIYSSDSQDIVFVDSKKRRTYRYPFKVNGKDLYESHDFEDSIVALD